MKKKLLFADLDGMLIETASGKTFPEGTWDMRLRLDVADAVKKYEPDQVVVVSNQGGIELGYVGSNAFTAKIRYVCSALTDYTGVPFLFDYCTSNDKEDRRRKPNPGMLEDYFSAYHENRDDFDILMIGDASGKPGQFSDSDLRTAENFGCDYMDVDDFVLKYGPPHKWDEFDKELNKTFGTNPVIDFIKKNDVIMATKKQILESDELLQQKKRKAYHFLDEGFEEYKKFLSFPNQKKFCFKGYFYVEVKEQDDKEL